MLLLIEVPFVQKGTSMSKSIKLTFSSLTDYIFKALLAASKCDVFILHMFFKLYIRCLAISFPFLHVILVRLSLVFIKGNLTWLDLSMVILEHCEILKILWASKIVDFWWFETPVLFFAVCGPKFCLPFENKQHLNIYNVDIFSVFFCYWRLPLCIDSNCWVVVTI